MSNITGTIRARATIQESQSVNIYNVSVATANTETTISLSGNTKKFMIRCRGNAGIKLAFNVGESGSNYLTISPGTSYQEDGLNYTGNLYIQTTKPTQVIEVVEWE